MDETKKRLLDDYCKLNNIPVLVIETLKSEKLKKKEDLRNRIFVIDDDKSE